MKDNSQRKIERPPFPASDTPSKTIIWAQQDGFMPLVDPPDLGLQRYRLCKEIERGGMGTIFLARDLQLSRDVAVKVLRIDPAANPEAITAYANEARIMSYLSHPGVAPIYDSGFTEAGRPFTVMKLVHGETLLEMLESQNPKHAELLSVFADICQTMAFAHSYGVLHLDLKPANVMVGAFGEVFVMDWGLAKFEGSPPEELGDWVKTCGSAIKSGGVAGTPEYMSPEQASGKILDARADVFSLGAILCKILTGQAPYAGRSLREAYQKALGASIGDALQKLEACDTDRALVRLTKRCLCPKRKNRPQNALEVSRELAAYQETALQRAESDMNRFFDLSLDLFCIADFEGYFRRINSNFSRVLGYSNQELLARPFLDFVHPEDVEQTVRQMSVMKEGQPVVRFSNRYKTANGRYVTLEWMAKADAQENVIFAVARDITES